MRMRHHLGEEGSMAQDEIQETWMKAASPKYDSDKLCWITALLLGFLEGYIDPL